MDCIFCKIAKKQALAEIVFEDDLIIAFKDIHPLAPVHVLIIPKVHIESAVDLDDKDEILVGRMILVAKKIADDLKISHDGYKLLIRVGEYGGQEMGHIHLHLIGGAPLAEGIRPIK